MHITKSIFFYGIACSILCTSGFAAGRARAHVPEVPHEEKVNTPKIEESSKKKSSDKRRPMNLKTAVQRENSLLFPMESLKC